MEITKGRKKPILANEDRRAGLCEIGTEVRVKALAKECDSTQDATGHESVGCNRLKGQ